MKTISKLALVLMAMLTIACNRSQNITMMTQINNDGRSCIRCFYFHTDSASLVTDVDTIGNDYLRIGREWKRQWCFTQADSVYHELPMTSQQYAEIREELDRQGIDKSVEDTILVVAERHYNTTEEMSADLPLMLADKPLTATSISKKNFRWFYTDYHFSESYASCDSLFSIPITDYVDKDVASYWFTGKPNLADGVPGAGMKEMLDNVEERISQWVNANIADEICNQIIERYDEVVNPPVSREQFIALRDSIIHFAVLNLDFYNEASRESNFLCDYFHSDAYTPLVSSEEMDDALEQRYGFYGALIGFNVQYNMSMPGQFKHFDIEPLRFTGEFLIPHDYTITASSRVVHPWAFVATLLLILIPLFLFRRKRKEK